MTQDYLDHIERPRDDKPDYGEESETGALADMIAQTAREVSEPKLRGVKIEFIIGGVKRGSSTILVAQGRILTANAEDEFYATLRKNERSIIAEVEAEELDELLNGGLTKEQNDLLESKHAEDYHGTDDDMPDAYEAWLMDLTLAELKAIIKV